MINSHIAWTDDTANPITVEGGGFYCAKVSAGCTNCYAEIVNKRICGFQGVKAYDFMNMKEPPLLHLKEDMLASWARKKRPRKIFVSSMTDVFGEFVPDHWIIQILDAMVAAPQHIFQVLTKRATRMRYIVEAFCELRGIDVLPQHIWLIVSVENQDTVDRAVELIATRCITRGLSIEPLLGEINLCLPLNLQKYAEYAIKDSRGSYGLQELYDTKIITHLDWVIVGGESGHKARIMHPEWVYSLKRQCRMHDVPFFFKQWGEWVAGTWDRVTGAINLEDSGQIRYNSNYKVFEWPDGLMAREQVVSVRVGKRERWITYKESVSDNALLNGQHFFEFPKYLTEHAG